MSNDLGLGLHPGDKHYRAYVGPPEDYDLVAAMTFNLLTTLGLRQRHALLDIGCGSLRLGRLFIPYLNKSNYTGVEPNRWLVDEGIAREVGDSLLQIKQPRFSYSTSAEDLGSSPQFDFAVAQSIFSHTGLDALHQWLARIASLLKPTGALAATFLPGDKNPDQSGWIYPGCVNFPIPTMQVAAKHHGFSFTLLDWRHPRQSWALFFAKPNFDTSWFQSRPLTWNTWLDHAPKTP